MQLWRITDEQYIARIRRWHRTRRYWGLAAFVVGIVVCAGFCLLSKHAFDNVNELLDTVNKPLDAPQPHGATLQSAMDNMELYHGIIFGSMLSMGFVSGGILAGLGLGFLLDKKDRKNRMLLDCWDRLNRDPDADSRVAS